MPNEILQKAGIDLKQAEFDVIGTAFTRVLPHQFWVDTKFFVAQIWDNHTLTGEQKRKFVSDQLHKYFQNDLEPILKVFGETFVDIAIKTAVIYTTFEFGPVVGSVAQTIAEPIHSAIQTDLNTK